MELPKKTDVHECVFKAQFNYCPLVWVFYSRSLNNKINRLHKCCLRINYNDKRSNFGELDY